MNILLSTLNEKSSPLHEKNAKLTYMKNLTVAERVKYAMDKAGIQPAGLAKAAGISRSAVSQWVRGETKTIKAKNLLAIANFLKVRFEWLETGAGPMSADGENVTEFLQTDRLESGSLEGPIMFQDDGSIGKLLTLLEKHRDELNDFRIVPVVGKILRQDGHTMLKQQELGYINVHCSDPAARCYEETTNEFAPRIKAREVIVVSPNLEPQSLDEVLIVMNDDTATIKELVRSLDDGYYVDDINERDDREFISKADVKEMFVVDQLPRSGRQRSRPFKPEIPKWVDNIIYRE